MGEELGDDDVSPDLELASPVGDAEGFIILVGDHVGPSEGLEDDGADDGLDVTGLFVGADEGLEVIGDRDGAETVGTLEGACDGLMDVGNRVGDTVRIVG